MRRRIRASFAGQDVSLTEASIYGISERVPRGVMPAALAGAVGRLKIQSLALKRGVQDSGQLSIWRQRVMAGPDLPAMCIIARKAHKMPPARPN